MQSNHEPSRWSQPGSSRVPFWAYTDAQLYQKELDAIFYGDHWSYVGLEVEIPNVGDYKLSHVGERQVLMVRDRKKLESDPHGTTLSQTSQTSLDRQSKLGGPTTSPLLS